MKPSDSLQDFAYEEIKKRIQNGEYAPGTKLNTQEISDSLGISRSPVLLAINRLIALGLVEATPRKGTTVAQLSDTQIRNIIEARQMMELFLCKLCIRNMSITPASSRRWRPLCRNLKPHWKPDIPRRQNWKRNSIHSISPSVAIRRL